MNPNKLQGSSDSLKDHWESWGNVDVRKGSWWWARRVEGDVCDPASSSRLPL